MTVSVTEAKNKLAHLLRAVEKGERVTIDRHGRAIAELVQPSVKKVPKFGTLKGIVQMTPDQFDKATRPMAAQETEAFLAGRY